MRVMPDLAYRQAGLFRHPDLSLQISGSQNTIRDDKAFLRFFLGSVLLIAAACSSSENLEKKNTEVAQKLFEAFNQHDWKTMTDLYAEQAQFLDPSFGPELVTKSRTETIAKYEEMQSAFPDIHDAVQNIYPSGETVTVEFISTGIAPDGTKFSLPIVSILTIREGLIVKDATYYDL